MHSALITLHALAGTVAFGCGVAALRRPGWFAAYYWSMVVMATSVAAAVAVAWAELDTVTRLVFAGLLVLAAVMVSRAELARRLAVRGNHPSPDAVGHIGFTLVGLADAFLVVTVMNLGAPGGVAVAVAVLVAGAGHVAVGRVRRRAVHRPDGMPVRRRRTSRPSQETATTAPTAIRTSVMRSPG